MLLKIFVVLSVFLHYVLCDILDSLYINLSELYIRQHGYPVEPHWVTTKDGYILYLVRISHGIIRNVGEIKRPPVLITHGLLSSSQDFVAYPTNQSLSYFCADNGYDVWLANFRGAPGSVNHTVLDPKKDAAKFWDISLSDLGEGDLPDLIDYILEKTNEEKLFYIGHSQGGSAFFAMASFLPEYNNKIRLASSLASVTELVYPTNNLLVVISKFWKPLQKVTNSLGIYEIIVAKFIRESGKIFCPRSESYSFICRLYLLLLMGYDEQGQLSTDVVSETYKNFPSSASLTQFYHILQLYESGKWQKFDYGPNENLRRYGTVIPPEYDISSVTAPVAYYHSVYDVFTNAKDAWNFARKLPNSVLFYTVPNDKFNHNDFIIGKDVVPLVYNKVIEVMKNF